MSRKRHHDEISLSEDDQASSQADAQLANEMSSELGDGDFSTSKTSRAGRRLRPRVQNTSYIDPDDDDDSNSVDDGDEMDVDSDGVINQQDGNGNQSDSDSSSSSSDSESDDDEYSKSGRNRRNTKSKKAKKAKKPTKAQKAERKKNRRAWDAYDSGSPTPEPQLEDHAGPATVTYEDSLSDSDDSSVDSWNEDEFDGDGPQEQALTLIRSSKTVSIKPLQLTLQVPEGPTRVVVMTVNIDAAQLLQEEGNVVQPEPLRSLRKTAKEKKEKDVRQLRKLLVRREAIRQKLITAEEKAGRVSGGLFQRLPGEIRNQIYDYALKPDQDVNFNNPGEEFQLSSALLSTCKMIHEEARAVLYSNRTFIFRRRSSRSGSLWTSNWNELGYYPAYVFLNQIGPTNISLLRNVAFRFDDAVPALNPDMKSADARRFVVDPYLPRMFALLARYGALKTIELDFNGRRKINEYYPIDKTFLKRLVRIKVDEVSHGKTLSDDIPHYMGWSYRTRVLETRILYEKIKKKMERPDKLYGPIKEKKDGDKKGEKRSTI